MIYNKHWLATFMGFPGGASGKEPACQCRRGKKHFDPWIRKIPCTETIKDNKIIMLSQPLGLRVICYIIIGIRINIIRNHRQ